MVPLGTIPPPFMKNICKAYVVWCPLTGQTWLVPLALMFNPAMIELKMNAWIVPSKPTGFHSVRVAFFPPLTYAYLQICDSKEATIF